MFCEPHKRESERERERESYQKPTKKPNKLTTTNSANEYNCGLPH